MTLGKIEFQTNVPMPLRLKYPNGKEVESRIGLDAQVMFSTTEGRVFFVSLGASSIIHEQLAELGVKPGEPIVITKAETRSPSNRKQTQWKVRRGEVQAGEQADGTFAVPKAGADARTPAPVRAAASQQQPNDNGNGSKTNGNGNGHAPDASQQPAQAHLPWALHLLSTTNALSDVYASAVAHAITRHGGFVKADDVRQFVITAFISQTKKGGGPNAA